MEWQIEFYEFIGGEKPVFANMKKKNKTSKNDLEISRQRMLDYKERFK